MTTNSYLTQFANSAIIRDIEKEKIQRSISAIKSRLQIYFSGELEDHFLFGSYSRNTILPRNMDQNSDIDYMVIFNDSRYRPQTYLDKLRRFVNTYYSNSEIFQSNPTIVLSLNHIKIELVPAIKTWLNGIQIPAKASAYDDWIDTDPNDFNQTLVNANQANHNLIKPTIRLVKYWNAKNNYPFESFILENTLANKLYWNVGGLLGYGQLQDYFFDAIESIESSWNWPQWKKTTLSRAKEHINEIKYYQQNNMDGQAELKVKKLIPPLLTSVGILGSYL